MANILNDEEVLCSINSCRSIKVSGKIANAVTNFLAAGIGGGIVNNFKLVLTSKKIYIQAIQYLTWGSSPEILYTDEIAREDIKFFEVKTQETEEFITITTIDDKKMTFIRENKENNDLGLIMARFISENH